MVRAGCVTAKRFQHLLVLLHPPDWPCSHLLLFYPLRNISSCWSTDELKTHLLHSLNLLRAQKANYWLPTRLRNIQDPSNRYFIPNYTFPAEKILRALFLDTKQKP
jgi:hypothetical protein